MKPILFNTDMVRAILEGRKTVTRRVVKPQPPVTAHIAKVRNDYGWSFWEDDPQKHYMKPPYRPGDILWVKETWRAGPGQYLYRAWAGAGMEPDKQDAAMREMGLKWRPSIHMPREAARIFLRVTDVRVERLDDMTTDDVFMEGVFPTRTYEHIRDRWHQVWNSTIKPKDRTTYGWEANPWVWVIRFDRIREEDIGQ